MIGAVCDGGLQALPETVLGTVQARFDAVGADAKRVLRAASVFGQSFRARGVHQVLGDDPDGSLDQWLEVLVRNEMVFARAAADAQEFVFRHALLQEAAYDMLTAADRSLGHRRAGEFLEASGEREAIVLVEHYQRGGEPDKAARWCRVAAEQALDATDLGEVLRRVERGLRVGAQGETLAALRRAEAQAHFWRGEYAEAEVAARVALDSSSGTMRFLAGEELLAALGLQMKFDEIDQLLRQLARSPAASAAEERAWLGCQLRGATGLLVGGRYQRTEQLLAEIEQHRSALDDAQQMRLGSVRGQFALHHGNQAAGLSAFQEALRKAQALGDLRVATEMLLNVGMVFLDLGLFEEAERMLDSTLEEAERMGLPFVSACGLMNLSWAQGHLGRLPEATRSAAQSRALARQQGDRRIEGASDISLAIIALRGAPDRAEAHARDAIEALRTVPPVLPAALATLARVLLVRGRHQEALASAAEAFALFQQLGKLEDGEASVYLAYGQCLLAAGDRERAREVLAAGARRLEARAALIDRPEWRMTFLERIPDHAQIIALDRAGG